jgi:hypothetical protein
MRRTAIHRLLIAGTTASATTLMPLLGSTAAANPPPGPAASTTAFQIPVTFLSGCGVGFRCYLPPLVPLTPTATTRAPGEVTFQLARPSTYQIDSYDCIGVTVNWRNLTTGATGTTQVRRVPIDYSRTTPQDFCAYTPSTVETGRGVVTATADARTHDHRPISPGVVILQVP